MPRVKPLGVNPTEQKIVALLYGAMETEGRRSRKLTSSESWQLYMRSASTN